MNDFFEAFNVGVETRSFGSLDLDESDYGINLWPDELPDFRSGVERYFGEAPRVARTLTGIFDAALELPTHRSWFAITSPPNSPVRDREKQTLMHCAKLRGCWPPPIDETLSGLDLAPCCAHPGPVVRGC